MGDRRRICSVGYTVRSRLISSACFFEFLSSCFVGWKIDTKCTTETDWLDSVSLTARCDDLQLECPLEPLGGTPS